MDTKKSTLFFFVITLSLLLTSCSTGNENFDADVATVVAQTQTALTQAAPPATPTAELTGDYQPISEQECEDLKATLSQRAEVGGEITAARFL